MNLDAYEQIVVLTGAGISVASGLRPYRGPGGVWEDDPEAERLATAEGLARDPAAIWRLFGPIRRQALAARPNPAHLALARLEERCLRDGRSFTLITQNVDGLHRLAGNREVVEFHGCITRNRCTDPRCGQPPGYDSEEHPEGPPPCPLCASALRPDIVLFGEEIPAEAEWRAKRALRECDLFMAVGTSGRVAPAANFVRSARYVGARTVLVNLEPLDPPDPSFQEEHLGPAEELLPRLLG
ncbi:MAG: NAD-dependent deacylase [Armatimonadetes bacterium]|nr:NAD-dependent deacylase [Armatimonadota bacterium]